MVWASDSPFLALVAGHAGGGLSRAKRRQGLSIGHRQLGFQSFVKGMTLQGRLPACWLETEIGAPARSLAGWIDADGAVWRPDDPYHLSLRAFRSAGDARPLWNVTLRHPAS
jgi:hypothetical protein